MTRSTFYYNKVHELSALQPPSYSVVLNLIIKKHKISQEEDIIFCKTLSTKNFENIVCKGRNAGNHHFLNFSSIVWNFKNVNFNFLLCSDKEILLRLDARY